MSEQQLSEIKKFIAKELHCVVSTVGSQSKPESALVAFSETEELEIVFATAEYTRKVINIQQNNNVSIVVGLGGSVSIQCEGIAHVIEFDEAGEYAQSHYKKQPGSKEYLNRPGECFVVVKPNWFRYTDISSQPETVFEITLND
jgi:general stress protein 26